MRTTPLRRVATVIAGQSPATGAAADYQGGLPFIQGNAEFGKRSPHPHLQCDTAPKRAATGDVLLSVRAPVGAMNWADRDLGIGRGVAALRPSGDWDSRFLSYGIQSQLPVLRAAAVGSTFDAVTADTLGSLELPEAVPAQQCKIADFLDDRVARIDQIIAARRQQIDVLEEYKQSLITAAVTGEIDVTTAGSRIPG